MSFGLGILKPDCLKRGLEAEVYRMITSTGLRIIFKKRMLLNIQQLWGLYGKWSNEEFYPSLCQYMLSGEVEVFVVKGDEAIHTLQSIVGRKNTNTFPPECTIRGKFATSQRENIVHSTKSWQTFIEEAKVLLGDSAVQWINSLG